MIPTTRFVWLVGLGVPVFLLGLLSPAVVRSTVVATVALAVAGAVDAVLAWRGSRLDVRRIVPRRWVQGRPETVALEVRNRGGAPSRVTLREQRPEGIDILDRVLETEVAPHGSRRVDCRVVPRERGTPEFVGVVARVTGPLGLVARQRSFALPDRVSVYPDLVSLSTREATLVSPSAWRLGVRRGRFQGEGREFHQLREYVAGDDVRSIDWKAYARRGEPTVREHQLERNQRVHLVIDAGRMMTVRVGDRSRFDWAVQAAGRVARAVLAVGDSVGLTVFSRGDKVTLPSARTAGQLGAIADALCHVRPDLDEPDLGGALTRLLGRATRRSLVVLFTELSDPRAANAALEHIGRLAPRHLGLVVTLADADLERERELPVADAEHAFRRVAADEVWQDRRRVERTLRTRGALVVRARADALAAEAVERYLEIKRRGRL